MEVLRGSFSPVGRLPAEGVTPESELASVEGTGRIRAIRDRVGIANGIPGKWTFVSGPQARIDLACRPRLAASRSAVALRASDRSTRGRPPVEVDRERSGVNRR